MANCLVYKTDGKCKYCQTDFFAKSETECAAVTTKTANCELYESEDKCLLCKSAYLRDYEKKSCIAKPSDSKCHGYNWITCNACDTNYIKDPLLAWRQITDDSVVTSYSTLLSSNTKVDPKMECAQKNVPKCSVFASFNICTTCSTGYFLTDLKKCQKFPDEVIPNCEIYSSLIACSQCRQGFFKENSTTCKAITPVLKCQSYSQTAAASQCDTCISGWYANSISECLERTLKTINNCAALNTTKDECLTCNSGYALNSTKKSCLQILPSKCKLYSVSDTALNCSACDDLYYFTASSGDTAATCTLGTKTNCKKFKTTEDKCLICANKFWLSDTSAGTCTDHDTIPNCLTYSNSTKNKCETCNSQYQAFTVNKKCVSPASTINNCTTYLDATHCQTCASRYYKNSDNTACSNTNFFDNCAVYHHSNKCT
ncbi:MAG: hypothetical protein GY938_12665 [Ketobacter sp.]|nr:hypothetical protein [Ketobacter sp.]